MLGQVETSKPQRKHNVEVKSVFVLRPLLFQLRRVEGSSWFYRLNLRPTIESALTQKPSTQIPRALNQHETIGTTKKLSRCRYFNLASCITLNISTFVLRQRKLRKNSNWICIYPNEILSFLHHTKQIYKLHIYP